MSAPQEAQYFDKILKSGATFLARWAGANVELWELTHSHKTLRIVVRRDGGAENLVISCIYPLRIRGPVRWTNANIAIGRSAVPDGPDDGFVVVDAGADVEILCEAWSSRRM